MDIYNQPTTSRNHVVENNTRKIQVETVESTIRFHSNIGYRHIASTKPIENL